MKTTILPLLVAVGLLSSASAQTPTGDLTNGLIAYYSLNGNPNNSVSDKYNLDIYQNTYTTNAYLTFNRFNQPDSAYYFSGYEHNYLPSGGLVSSNNFPYLNSLTVSSWFQMDPNNTNNNGRIIENDWGQGSWNIAADAASSRLYAMGIPENYNENQSSLINLNTPVTIGTWNNVVFTYNGYEGFANLYLNGVLVDSQTGLPALRNRGDNILEVGGHDETFTGSISDVGIWNRALSSNEVSTLYVSQAVPEPSTYALFGIGAIGMLLVMRRKKGA